MVVREAFGQMCGALPLPYTTAHISTLEIMPINCEFCRCQEKRLDVDIYKETFAYVSAARQYLDRYRKTCFVTRISGGAGE